MLIEGQNLHHPAKKTFLGMTDRILNKNRRHNITEKHQ